MQRPAPRVALRYFQYRTSGEHHLWIFARHTTSAEVDLDTCVYYVDALAHHGASGASNRFRFLSTLRA
ncbi:hypothetical protein CQ018_08905 [Arthrobacter sp. MYb227]|nr:hypothetical protein CQ018_08905 [Arthrobacter sp. MYb227]